MGLSVVQEESGIVLLVLSGEPAMEGSTVLSRRGRT